jgi:hypothetical protein
MFSSLFQPTMSHNSRRRSCWSTPSPTNPSPRWKIFPHISRYPLAADFDSPDDLVYVGCYTEELYRQIKPHRSMSDDSEREKAFADKMRKMKQSSEKKRKASKGSVGIGTPQEAPIVAVSVGHCAAMGSSFCPFPDLQNNRHFCNGCDKGMHAIAPCSGAYDGEKDTHLCGMCEYNGDKVNQAPRAPKKMSVDMLLDSDEDEEEELFLRSNDDDEDDDAAMPPLAAMATKPAPSSTTAGAFSSSSTRKSRGPNFGNEEDTFITRALCAATEDSHKGTGQKQQDFNKTLFSNYVSICDEYND